MLRRRQGLIYDFEIPDRQLRVFAFTTYRWIASDLAYTSIRPRRLPVQMFESRDWQRFVLLSFGRIRIDPQTMDIFTPQFVFGPLGRDRKAQNLRDKKCIIVLSTGEKKKNIFDANRRRQPFYAIPVSAIEPVTQKNANLNKEIRKGGSERKNHSRWQELVLKSGKSLLKYRFDNYQDLIAFLGRACVDHDADGQQNGRDRFKPSTLSRSDILAMIEDAVLLSMTQSIC